MKKHVQDFTQGNLWVQMIKFSLPLIFSNLLQVLFNMADVAVVGQFAGANALGSVGSTTIFVTLFTTALIGISGGMNVLIAQSLGANRPQETNELVHNSAILSVIIGVITLLIGLVFGRPILELLNTKPELIDGAVIYVQIYFLGMPAMMLYNFGNAVLSAAGDTKRPLKYLSISGVLNVVLNLILVIVFHLDVAGVAIASIISQYLSAFLVLRALVKSQDSFALRFSDLKFQARHAKAILALGLPSGAQNAVFQIANLFVQRSVNRFSATVVSGNSAAANADGLVYETMAALYTACACFIGQNYGAGKKDRILKSYFISLIYSFGIGAVIGLGILACGRNFLGIFTTDPTVIEAGMYRLTIMGFSYPISAFMDNTICASRGLGKSVVPAFIVIMGSCVFRLIWIYTIFEYFETITSLYLLYVFSWTITAIVEIIYFVKIYKDQTKTLV
ncbi:MAG: MATE family efflux transporter [Lachnospiraceae bacterium]|nr:MATE family efflux transporter [Lachnospiraceae bacterium]